MKAIWYTLIGKEQEKSHEQPSSQLLPCLKLSIIVEDNISNPNLCTKVQKIKRKADKSIYRYELTHTHTHTYIHTLT